MSDFLHEISLLRQRGILKNIDVELCRFLKDQLQETSEDVLIAACLTSAGYREGNVCISLDEYADSEIFENSKISSPDLNEWKKQLEGSHVVGKPGEFKPLVLDSSNRLYLHKLWQYEQSLSENILTKTGQQDAKVDLKLLGDGIHRLFESTGTGDNWQQVAAVAVLLNRFSVISGGPGTGKTTTVVRVLALMLEQGMKEDSNPAIALAAPTGKAAARLKDAIVSSKQQLNVGENIKNSIPSEAVTIHQLLGARRHSAQFRYNADNPLPYDAVIIDEASMVDQALMSKLLEALLTDTKLILIGDKDQLASVEAGSVLGSICRVDHNRLSKQFAGQLRSLSINVPDNAITTESKPLTDHIVLLEKSYRFEEKGGIQELSNLINRGDADSSYELLASEEYEGIEFIEIESAKAFDRYIEEKLVSSFAPIVGSNEKDHLFDRLNGLQILSPHRVGPWGVEHLNRRIEDHLVRAGVIAGYERWYHGKPVIINQNDYTLGLNNGDIGICWKDEEGEPLIYFQQEQFFKSIAPSRLPAYSTAYALTVHKSQGSEYDHVMLILPDKISKVITRELLYTAVTRAREKVTIIGQRHVLKEGIRSELRRSSGLKKLLWHDER